MILLLQRGEDSSEDDEGRRRGVKAIIMLREMAPDTDVLMCLVVRHVQVKFLFLSLEKGSFPCGLKGLSQLITTASS